MIQWRASTVVCAEVTITRAKLCRLNLAELRFYFEPATVLVPCSNDLRVELGLGRGHHPQRAAWVWSVVRASLPGPRLRSRGQGGKVQSKHLRRASVRQGHGPGLGRNRRRAEPRVSSRAMIAPVRTAHGLLAQPHASPYTPLRGHAGQQA